MNAQHTSQIADLLPAFALGALEGAELRDLLAHLETGCATCRDELALLAGDLEALGGAVEAPPPGTSFAVLRERLLAALPERAPVRGEPSLPPAPAPASDRGRPGASVGGGAAPSAAARSYRLPFWLAAAALLLLSVITVWSVARQSALGGQAARLAAERDRLQARAAALERQVAQVQIQAERMARSLSVVAAPGVQAVRLAGQGPAGGAAGRTFVDPANRKAVFYAFDLPALGADQTYQLWFIDDAKHPSSAGIFAVDARGRGTLEVENLLPVERIRTWAVTIEPRGGVPQPTGPIVLVG